MNIPPSGNKIFLLLIGLLFNPNDAAGVAQK
jgi:hypothetical protein